MKNRRYPRRVNMENERKNTRRRMRRVTRRCNRKGIVYLLHNPREFLDSRGAIRGKERRGGVRIRHNFGAAEHAVVNIA